jgi:hypothetical protein
MHVFAVMLYLTKYIWPRYTPKINLAWVVILRHNTGLWSFIQGIRPGPRLYECFRNKVIFYGEELLAPRPTPKLEDHPLSAGDQVKEDEMGRACSTNGGEEECI